MNKYFNTLFILLLFISNTFVYSFDFDSYRPRKLENLIKDIKWIIQDTEKKTGEPVEILQFNNPKYKMIIKLEKFPKKIESKYKEFAEKISKELFKVENLFTYQFKQEYNGINLVFLVQEPLMEYLKKEAKIGNLIELYVMFYEYRKTDNELIMSLNEFNTRSEKFDESILPDME